MATVLYTDQSLIEHKPSCPHWILCMLWFIILLEIWIIYFFFFVWKDPDRFVFYTVLQLIVYSRTSIHRSRIGRFPPFTVQYFWSRNKSHINNVIYSRIYCSANDLFPALIVCKLRSWRRISRMNRQKNWLGNMVIIICVTFSLDYKTGNTVTQSRGSQLR
jgi:hypothetical protein